MTERKLIANVTLSIDGFSAGPGGDMGWLVEHSVHDQMTTYFAGVWSGADTVLLGRSNYEGFFGATTWRCGWTRSRRSSSPRR